MKKFFNRLGLGYERGATGDAKVDSQKTQTALKARKGTDAKHTQEAGADRRQTHDPYSTLVTDVVNDKGTLTEKIVFAGNEAPTQPSKPVPKAATRHVEKLIERYENPLAPPQNAKAVPIRKDSLPPTSLQDSATRKSEDVSASPPQSNTIIDSVQRRPRSPTKSWGRRLRSSTLPKEGVATDGPANVDDAKLHLPEADKNRTTEAMLPAVLGAAAVAPDKGKQTQEDAAAKDVKPDPLRQSEGPIADAQLIPTVAKAVAFAPSPSKSRTSSSGQRPFPAAGKDASDETKGSGPRPATSSVSGPGGVNGPVKGRTHFHEIGITATNKQGRSSQSSLHAARPLSDSSKGFADRSQKGLLIEAAHHRSSMQSNAKRPTEISGRARQNNSSVNITFQSQSHDSPNRASNGTAHRSMSPASIDGPPRLTLAEQSPQGSSRTTLASRLGAGSPHQGWSSAGARSVGGPSWSEMTQEELVANLGARERTRQEVLWEIVASEERYVQELHRAQALYFDALLGKGEERGEEPLSPRSHALALLEGNHSASPRSSPDTPQQQAGRLTPSEGHGDHSPTTASSKALPIASRYGSGIVQQIEEGRAPRVSTDAGALRDLTSFHQNRASPTSQRSLGLSLTNIESRASSNDKHLSAASPAKSDTHSPAAKSAASNPARWMTTSAGKHAKKDLPATPSKKGSAKANELPALPAALARVLKALDNGMVEGHAALSEALRCRYEEQWPLVRSLADIFNRFSYVLEYYREYVIHLERALDALDEAQLMERAMRGKRLRKDRVTPAVALGRRIAELEAFAAEQGECGLSIFLSMPFQRLLKYPLLFQNLLFHTDASTYEFESTVRMVVDVERLVRLIEDEKISKEERDKTIDAFARIESINDRRLLRPRKDRLLLEEKPLYAEIPRRAHSDTDQLDEQQPPATAMSTPIGGGMPASRAPAQGRRSYRRLSELLAPSSSTEKRIDNADADANAKPEGKTPSMGSKRDIWALRFTDVEIRCQRVGMTALPVVSSTSFGSTIEQRQSYDDWLQRGDNEDELRIKDDFKRNRESKERQRALRNHTLRSKTRNLYKFISVTRWRETSEKPMSTKNTQMAEVVEEEDGEACSTEESSSSEDSDDGMLDTGPYIRQNKLSFSYLGNDRVEPRLPATNHRWSANSAESLITSRQTGLYTLDKTISASNVTGVQRDARDAVSPPTKRLSHNAPVTSSPLANTGSPSRGDEAMHVSSKVSRTVAATSKSRAEKFGTRLRQDHARRASGGEGNASQPTFASAAHASSRRQSKPQEPLPSAQPDIKQDDGDAGLTPAEIVKRASLTSSTLLSSANGASGQAPLRFPSFVRDRSIDSNLRLMGTLVQTPQSQMPLANEEADQSLTHH